MLGLEETLGWRTEFWEGLELWPCLHTYSMHLLLAAPDLIFFFFFLGKQVRKPEFFQAEEKEGMEIPCSFPGRSMGNVGPGLLGQSGGDIEASLLRTLTLT